jgi:mono/diheme cytochrome c family protein
MKIVLILMVIFLVACGNSESGKAPNSVALGQTIFTKNCMDCHGNKAQGIAEDWRKPLANGKYPAPPLNGTAHGWHHSPKVLLNSINNGGEKFGGWMPAFKDKLSEKEKLAVLDYLYSLWPKEIQQKYDRRFK